MQSFNEIRNDFLMYANSQNLEGVAVEKLCNLLAYSAYKNQILQAKISLEASFPTSTSLNSRLHHAANYQYSVPRGKCPVISVSNIMALQTKTYKHLDYIMPFNGYYFYIDLSKDNYSKDVTQSYPVDGGINLLCSSYPLREETESTSDDFYFVDFIGAENASSDYLLYYKDASGSLNEVDPNVITEDSSLFYYKIEDTSSEGSYKYAYDYLVITLPSYGIRVIRHSDTVSWQGSEMTLKYIPYNETSPDFTNLRSITGFTLQEDSDTETYTKLDVIPFEPRLDNLDQIYANATASYLQQGSVATPEDLVIYLKKFNAQGVYRVYSDVRIDFDDALKTYTINPDATYATVVYVELGATYEEVQSKCNDFKGSLSVVSNIVVVPAKYKITDDLGNEVNLRVVAYSSNKVLTDEALSNLVGIYRTRIGQSLNHSQLEADIVRLGFDYVKIYNDGTDVETSFNITCEKYEVPSIKVRVRE